MGTTRISKVNQFLFWLKKQPKKVKILLAVVYIILSLLAIVVLEHTLYHHGYLLIACDLFQFAGLVILSYKLDVNKSCAGLSLKSQELIAITLITKLLGVGSIPDSITSLLSISILAATAWVIYMIRFKLKSTYIKDLDNFRAIYLIVSCAILSVLIHPYMNYTFFGIGWAFTCYLEAVSVWPQLHLMKNSKVAEPFTAHYVFALGLSRFFHCANWIIQLKMIGWTRLFTLGSTYLWFPAAIIAELIQTFILSDFCYYYVKSYMDGQFMMRMPV